MDDKTGKIKIRRSSGKIQYVTRAELDELNDRRKRRDQERGWGKVSNPAQQLLSMLLLILAFTILAFWVSSRS
jgi:hypothetical protein